VKEARESGRSAFALVFQGVLLEEVEVAVIVLTLGAAHGSVALAAAAAAAAFIVVAIAAAVARHPLSRVPENALALAVGVMLTSFGVSWTVEGLRLEWPAGEAMLPLLVAAVAATSWFAVQRMRRAPTKLDA
jgi:Ca2+/H+ antiporter, TMEM165/GDT1 family